MGAHLFADALCDVGDDLHSLLRDVQRYADAYGDNIRFSVVERQLIHVLQNVDHLILLAGQQAWQELLADLKANPPTGANSVG